MTCPYAVLGVPPAADRPTLLAAYRREVKRRHPDTGGSEAAMVELNAAWGGVQGGVDIDSIVRETLERMKATEERIKATEEQLRRIRFPSWTPRTDWDMRGRGYARADKWLSTDPFIPKRTTSKAKAAALLERALAYSEKQGQKVHRYCRMWRGEPRDVVYVHINALDVCWARMLKGGEA